MAHDHNHDHEERELITLVDEQGNETLFEILLTIDGKEEFGKNYVLLIPENAEEDENGEVEIQAYSFTENEDGTEGDLQPIPEDSDAEWDMIEEIFTRFPAKLLANSIKRNIACGLWAPSRYTWSPNNSRRPGHRVSCKACLT